MLLSRLTAGAAALLLAAGCGSATDPAVRDGALVVETGTTALRLTNRGDQTVYTYVADQEVLPLIFWGPCADPERCEGIAPGATRELAYGVTAPARGRVAVVTWWHSRRTANGYAPDSLRTLVVPL